MESPSVSNHLHNHEPYNVVIRFIDTLTRYVQRGDRAYKQLSLASSLGLVKDVCLQTYALCKLIFRCVKKKLTYLKLQKQGLYALKPWKVE